LSHISTGKPLPFQGDGGTQRNAGKQTLSMNVFEEWGDRLLEVLKTLHICKKIKN
jgi:hypothetical protein